MWPNFITLHTMMEDCWGLNDRTQVNDSTGLNDQFQENNQRWFSKDQDFTQVSILHLFWSVVVPE